MMSLSDRTAAETHNSTNHETDLVGRYFLLRCFGVYILLQYSVTYHGFLTEVCHLEQLPAVLSFPTCFTNSLQVLSFVKRITSPLHQCRVLLLQCIIYCMYIHVHYIFQNRESLWPTYDSFHYSKCQ